MNFNSTIFFTISSFFYTFLLIILFYSKEKVHTIETKIYSILISINVLEVILELLLCLFAGQYVGHQIFYIILNKMYLISLLAWSIVFLIYIFGISKNNKYKMLKKIAISLFVVFMILIIILPIDFYLQNNYVLYSYGYAINALYFAVTICIVLMICSLVINYKNIKNKKYIPIFMFLFIGTLTTIIQNIYPFLLLTTAMEHL